MRDYNLDNAIRKIKDFPKKGILFYDITSIFTNPEAFNWIIDNSYDIFKNEKIDGIVAIEARGFVFASSLAYKLKIPLILARKAGKLPGKTIRQSYSLEYGEAILEIQEDDIKKEQNILIVDDLIATGGTIKACIDIVEKLGAKVHSILGLIGLPFLNYQEILNGYKIKTFINYDNE